MRPSDPRRVHMPVPQGPPPPGKKTKKEKRRERKAAAETAGQTVGEAAGQKDGEAGGQKRRARKRRETIHMHNLDESVTAKQAARFEKAIKKQRKEAAQRKRMLEEQDQNQQMKERGLVGRRQWPPS